MLDWAKIDTVILDMDGPIIDLNYDDYFWQQYLPRCYASTFSMPVHKAETILNAAYQKVYGTLDWYCIDYWSKELNLPMRQLLQEQQHKIRLRSDLPSFIQYLNQHNKQVHLLTNAHPFLLTLKAKITDLNQLIPQQTSCHEFKVAKESIELWTLFQQAYPFSLDRTVFIDDNLNILKTAQQFGFQHLIAIANPNSSQPPRNITEFTAITRYEQLL